MAIGVGEGWALGGHGSFFYFFSVHKDDWPGKGNLGGSVISCDKIR